MAKSKNDQESYRKREVKAPTDRRMPLLAVDLTSPFFNSPIKAGYQDWQPPSKSLKSN